MGLLGRLMDHATLIVYAAQWLRGQGCRLVLTDARIRANAEHPDAIGWLPDGNSLLIEAKSNIVDFRDDWRSDRKQFRRNGQGMGLARYYIAPFGVIAYEKVITRGWGLLHAYPGKVVLAVQSPAHTRNAEAEIRLIARVVSNIDSHQTQLTMDFQEGDNG